MVIEKKMLGSLNQWGTNLPNRGCGNVRNNWCIHTYY